MVTGHNNGLLDYLEHKDSIAHLQDFLDVVLPNLHQHYICRSTDLQLCHQGLTLD